MTSLRVSVIIPTYNRAGLVQRAVKSVLSQTYDDFEVLVVDDASMDETETVVRSFDDSRVRYLSHDINQHVSAARNTGIESARGDYIAFLDDDDEWLPKKLEKQVACLEDASSEVGMVYCWMDYYDGDGVVNRRHPTLSGDIFDEVLAAQPIGNASTLLVRSSVISDVGGFDESLPRGNDGDFIRRVAREYHVECVPEALIRYHVDHGFERITRRDETGIRNAINSQETKLEKFATELAARPALKAEILSKLGWRHCQLYEFGAAASCFARAIRCSPTTPTVYRYVAEGCFDILRQPVLAWIADRRRA